MNEAYGMQLAPVTRSRTNYEGQIAGQLYLGAHRRKPRR
jgi:hypothetical protein